MKMSKIFKWSLVALPVVIIAIGAFLYILASSAPSDYKPQTLDTAQKQAVRQKMQSKISALVDMSNIGSGGAGSGLENVQTNTITVIDPKTGKKRIIQRTTFEMPMDEDEVNQWIGAMSDTALDKLSSSGITQPAIAITEKGVTLFANVRKFDKVVGLDVGMDFRDDETCVFDVKPSSVGKLPIPPESIDDYREKAVEKARRDVKSIAATAKDTFEGETGELAGAVIEGMGSSLGDAIAGEPVKIQFEKDGCTVRVRGLKTVDGKVTLDMVSDKDVTPAQADKPAAPKTNQPTEAELAKLAAEKAAQQKKQIPPEALQAADLSAEQDKKLNQINTAGLQ